MLSSDVRVFQPFMIRMHQLIVLSTVFVEVVGGYRNEDILDQLLFF